MDKPLASYIDHTILKPDAVVLVATVRALKYNGGVAKENLGEENLEALKAGIVNLEKHIENVAKFKVPCVVTLNRFVTDTDAELQYIEQFCKERGCDFALSEVWEKGGEGGIALAKEVIHTLETKESDFTPLYDTELSIREKIEKMSAMMIIRKNRFRLSTIKVASLTINGCFGVDC